MLDFKKPFDGSASLTINPERSRRIDLIPYYKRSYEKEILAKTQSEKVNFMSKKSQSLLWSQLLNAVRTYFENLINET